MSASAEMRQVKLVAESKPSEVGAELACSSYQNLTESSHT